MVALCTLPHTVPTHTTTPTPHTVGSAVAARRRCASAASPCLHLRRHSRRGISGLNSLSSAIEEMAGGTGDCAGAELAARRARNRRQLALCSSHYLSPIVCAATSNDGVMLRCMASAWRRGATSIRQAIMRRRDHRNSGSYLADSGKRRNGANASLPLYRAMRAGLLCQHPLPTTRHALRAARRTPHAWPSRFASCHYSTARSLAPTLQKRAAV